MDSYLINDIEKLIQLRRGDRNRLEKIKQNYEQKKLVPLADRKYVERLILQYFTVPEDQNLNEINSKPDEYLPKISISNQEKYQKNKNLQTKRGVAETEIFPQKVISKNSKKENKKILGIGTAAVAMAIIVITIGSFSMMEQSSIPQENSITSQITTKTIGGTLSSPYITLSIDETEYSSEDIISIFGETDIGEKEEIFVSIKNPDGKTIWSENLLVKDNGEFATLTIAGGPNWEKNGNYNVIAKNGELESKLSFDFKT